MSKIDVNVNDSPRKVMIVRDVCLPLSTMTGWLRWLGIAFITQGVLSALTVLGLLVAWLPIWVGVLMVKASGSLREAHESEDEAVIEMAFNKLRSCMLVQGILMLVSVSIALAVVLFFGGTFMAMMFAGNWVGR